MIYSYPGLEVTVPPEPPLRTSWWRAPNKYWKYAQLYAILSSLPLALMFGLPESDLGATATLLSMLSVAATIANSIVAVQQDIREMRQLRLEREAKLDELSLDKLALDEHWR